MPVNSNCKACTFGTAFLTSTYTSSISATHHFRSCPASTRTAPTTSAWKMLDQGVVAVTPHPRIACLCQYTGTAFSGWERKPSTRTVQNAIENAISEVCGQSVRTAGASKTDAGTHAAGQVFHFDPPFIFSNARAWMNALNKRLPNDILVLEAHQKPLNVTRMNAAAQTLRYEKPKDFSAFRKTRSPAAHSNIIVHDISVHHGATDSNLVEIEVCASWFVYGMMRLLTAALVEVGSGSLAVEEFYDIFRLRQRHRIKNSAPASGLCLLEVGYPSQQNPFICSEQLSNSSQLSLGLSPYLSSRSVRRK